MAKLSELSGLVKYRESIPANGHPCQFDNPDGCRPSGPPFLVRNSIKSLHVILHTIRLVFWDFSRVNAEAVLAVTTVSGPDDVASVFSPPVVVNSALVRVASAWRRAGVARQRLVKLQHVVSFSSWETLTPLADATIALSSASLA